MKVYERQVSITDRVEIVELNKCLAINSDIKTELRKEEFFASKKEAGNWNKNPYKLNKLERKYLYFDDNFWKLADKVGLSNNKLWDLFPGCIINPIEAVKLPNFSEDKVVWFDGSSHLLYNLDAINPISMPYHVDYIGGITDQSYDLNKAKEILSKNPNVIRSEIMEIPYYNRDSGYQTLDFTVKLPQETHDMLCNYYRDVTKHKYWTVEIKRAIVWRPWLENKHGYNLDVLGLKECYIGKED